MLRRRFAALFLGGFSVLIPVAALHHPVVDTRSPDVLLSEMARLSANDRAFHAFMIGLVIALFFALAAYATDALNRRPPNVAALMIFATGCGALIGAALIDGFFLPAFGEHYVGRPMPIAQQALPVLLAAGIAIQVFSKFGLLAYAAAGFAWSLDISLSRYPVLGVLGALSAVLEAALILFNGALTAGSLAEVFAAQCVWCLIIAYRMDQQRRTTLNERDRATRT